MIKRRRHSPGEELGGQSAVCIKWTSTVFPLTLAGAVCGILLSLRIIQDVFCYFPWV